MRVEVPPIEVVGHHHDGVGQSPIVMPQCSVAVGIDALAGRG